MFFHHLSWRCWPALVVAWLLPSSARAEESWFARPGAGVDESVASRQQMVVQMRDYYEAERLEGYAFLGLGAGSIAAGVYALQSKNSDFVRGAAYPMLALGAVEFVGVGIYALGLGSRMAKQEARILRDPLGYQRDEGKRLEGTVGRFEFYRTAEIVVLMAGAGVFAVGSVDNKDTWRGAGAALMAHSLVLLTLDHFAEGRAREYLNQIRAFQPTAGLTADGARWLGVGTSGRF